MKTTRPRCSSALLAALLLAATSISPGDARADDDLPARYQRFDKVVASPKLLLEAANARNLSREESLRLFLLLGTLHPTSEEARVAFPLSVKRFRPLWHSTRWTAPRSEWHVVTPLQYFLWLERLSEKGWARDEARFLLLGMPLAFYERYEAFAAESPVLSKYALRMEKDNGVVDSLELVEQRAPAASTATGPAEAPPAVRRGKALPATTGKTHPAARTGKTPPAPGESKASRAPGTAKASPKPGG